MGTDKSFVVLASPLCIQFVSPSLTVQVISPNLTDASGSDLGDRQQFIIAVYHVHFKH